LLSLQFGKRRLQSATCVSGKPPRENDNDKRIKIENMLRPTNRNRRIKVQQNPIKEAKIKTRASSKLNPTESQRDLPGDSGDIGGWQTHKSKIESLKMTKRLSQRAREKAQESTKQRPIGREPAVSKAYVTVRNPPYRIDFFSFRRSKLIMVDTLSIEREIQNPNSGHTKQVLARWEIGPALKSSDKNSVATPQKERFRSAAPPQISTGKCAVEITRYCSIFDAERAAFQESLDEETAEP
jgi:hypothetical protein